MASAAIVLSYLDRQTLPWTLTRIHAEYPFSDQVKATFDSAFLVAYGLMYLGGGWLLDRLGTRRGFLLIMTFWSLAVASQGLAANYGMPPFFGLAFALLMLMASQFLLGVGEGGGFPAATRVVAEWFPVNERSTAMGIINGGTAVGAMVAPWFIFVIINHTGWFGVSSWRWVFIASGVLGLLWTAWWAVDYQVPERHRGLSEAERQLIASGQFDSAEESAEPIPLRELLSHHEVWGVVGAKFLTDAAWYFYLFWLPKFLIESFHIQLNAATSVGWIPYAASGVGCLVGGGFSSWLLKRGKSVNFSRKLALGASAALMPWVMLASHLHSMAWVIFLFSLAFFGQQSWSTLVMILPTDMIPKRAVGTFAGMIGFAGAIGGVLLGQLVAWLRDHGHSYTPALVISGSLHIIAFILICVVVPKIQPVKLRATRG